MKRKKLDFAPRRRNAKGKKRRKRKPPQLRKRRVPKERNKLRRLKSPLKKQKTCVSSERRPK